MSLVQRVFQCRKVSQDGCYHSEVSRIFGKSSEHYHPSHSKVCLLQTILRDQSLTLTEIIQTLCAEIPFFESFKKADLKYLRISINHILNKHKLKFKKNQRNQKWSSTSTTELSSTSQASMEIASTRQHLQVSQASVQIPRTSDQLQASKKSSKIASTTQQLQVAQDYTEIPSNSQEVIPNTSQHLQQNQTSPENSKISQQSQTNQSSREVQVWQDADSRLNEIFNIADEASGTIIIIDDDDDEEVLKQEKFFSYYIKVISDALKHFPLKAGSLEDIFEIISAKDETKHLKFDRIKDFLRIYGTQYFYKFVVTEDFNLWAILEEDLKLKTLILRYMKIFEDTLKIIQIGSAEEIGDFVRTHGNISSMTTQKILGVYGGEFFEIYKLGDDVLFGIFSS